MLTRLIRPGRIRSRLHSAQSGSRSSRARRRAVGRRVAGIGSLSHRFASGLRSFLCPAGEAGSARRGDIQGLRALAVLAVVLAHAGVRFLQGGYIGVDVFFVLSGFLITGLLLSGAANSGSASILEFYARRARRILPAAALTLVATDLVAYSLLNFVRAKHVVQDSIPASLFLANFHFAAQGTNYFAQGQPPSPLQHFWSLAVEEQFYLVWPLLLVLVLLGVSWRRTNTRLTRRPHHLQPNARPAVGRPELTIALITAASLGWSIYYTHAHPTESYFSTLTRAWELGLGATLAVCASRVSRIPRRARTLLGWLGVAAILGAAVSFSASTPFPSYFALLPTVGGVLVIASGLGRDHSRFAVARLLSTRPMRYVGDRSYAFYLWHWPVLVIALLYEGHALPVGVNLLLIGGAFLLSVASYALFENPIRRLQWSPSTNALLLWPMSVLAVVIVAGWAIGKVDATATRLSDSGAPAYPAFASYAFSSRTPVSASTRQQQPHLPAAATARTLPAVAASVAMAERSARIPTGLVPPVASLLNDHYNYPPDCAADDGQSSSNVCGLGDSSSQKSLVVMGDSHAQMWMPAILAMAQQDGWVVHPLGKSACIPLEWWHVMAATADCRAWYAWAMREIKNLHPTVTLFAAAFAGLEGHPNAAVPGLGSLITAARPVSKRVVVLADQPGQPQQPLDCLLAGDANMAKCGSRPTPAQLAIGETIQSATRAAGATYIDTRGWFCFENDCPMVIGHTIAWLDHSHITQSYAKELASTFRSAFTRALGHLG